MAFDLNQAVRDFVARVREAWVPGNVCTSWTRTEAENERVGGLPDSLHLLSLAIDVTGPQLARFERNCQARGLITEDEGDHLHVQAFEAFRIQEARESIAAPDEPMATLRELNVWLNELMGGEEGQTMSARMGKRIQEGDATLGERALCEALDMIDPEHCERAAEAFEDEDDEEEEHRSRHLHSRHHQRGGRRRRHHAEHCTCVTCGLGRDCDEEPWWLRPRPGDEGDEDLD